MKKWFLISCLSVCSLAAEAVSGPLENKENKVKADIEVSQGYRVDKNIWSISGLHHKPNIFSELTGKHIKIYQTRLATRLSFGDYFGRLQLGYGDVMSGTMRDSDYDKDNRRGEFSRAIMKIKGSYVWDGRISFGKTIVFPSSWTISPLIGYQWQTERLRMTSGYSTIPYRAKIKHLNSTYKSIWDAPFIGALAVANLSDNLSFSAEYNLFAAVHYIGKGNWNLRNIHFKFESQRMKGFGNMGVIGLSYKLFKNCSLKGEYQLSKLVAKGGKIKEVNGTTTRQPFRKATVTSSEVRLTLNYAF